MKRILFTAVALALLIPGLAKAQVTDGGTIVVDINDLLYVNIDVGDNQTLTPTVTDFDNAYVNAPTDLTILSGSNSAYDLFIRGATATWSYVGPEADPGKLVADLEFLPPGGSFTAMTQSNQTVESFANPGENSSTVGLRVALDYDTDVEGDYTMNYTVEVIAP
jgi:hypothetical protein